MLEKAKFFLRGRFLTIAGLPKLVIRIGVCAGP
jgi:hypothetical protein